MELKLSHSLNPDRPRENLCGEEWAKIPVVCENLNTELQETLFLNPKYLLSAVSHSRNVSTISDFSIISK